MAVPMPVLRLRRSRRPQHHRQRHQTQPNSSHLASLRRRALAHSPRANSPLRVPQHNRSLLHCNEFIAPNAPCATHEMLKSNPLMATSSRKPQRPRPEPPPAVQNQQPLLIDPRWILKALAATLAVALLFAYATLCLLFYQGQWQLVLHPSRTVATTPASLGLAFNEVHLFASPSGEPQLFGWLIPAATTSAPTALLLHGADGSIADALPSARTLHDAGLNVLLFDYRGFGRSAGQHPT